MLAGNTKDTTRAQTGSAPEIIAPVRDLQKQQVQSFKTVDGKRSQYISPGIVSQRCSNLFFNFILYALITLCTLTIAYRVIVILSLWAQCDVIKVLELCKTPFIFLY